MGGQNTIPGCHRDESEIGYQAIFNHSFDGILLTIPDGRILAANPAACRMFGRSEEEICRLGRNGLINLDDPGLLPALSQRERTGEFSGVLTGRRADGTIFPFELSTSVFTDMSGELRSSMIIHDISDQEKSNQKLRTTEMLLQSIISNVPLSIISTDKNGIITLLEGRRLKEVDLRPGEYVATSAYDIYGSRSYTEPSGETISGKEVIDRVLSGENMVVSNEFKGYYFENHLGPITDENGEITGSVGLVLNISDRKKAELEKEKSEMKYRDLLEKAVVPIWEKDYSEVKKFIDKLRKKGVRDLRKYFSEYPEHAAYCVSLVQTTFINQPGRKFFGIKEKQDLNKDRGYLLTDKNLKFFIEEIIVLTEGKREYDCDLPITLLSGQEKNVHRKAYVISDKADNLSQVLVSCIDLTDRINYENELLKSGETLRRLNMYIEEAREKERSHIAMNLHDDLGQKLTALKMNLSWLKKRIGVQSDLVSDKLEEIGHIIDSSISTVQTISSELRPTILYDLGLKEAIEWHLKHYLEPAGIKCSFRMSPADLRIDEHRSIVLFRVVQESLTNVIRHSAAKNVSITITGSVSFIQLVIRDDGKGINAEAINNPESLGIASMKERVKSISGDSCITGTEGHGTMITVKIPLSKNN